jgi:hypothetical protein
MITAETLLNVKTAVPVYKKNSKKVVILTGAIGAVSE